MPQPPYIEPIQYIRFDEQNYPIDAVTINGRSVNEFQESGKIVTSINSSSTDEQIPSAKCLYEMIWGPPYDYSKDYLTFEALEDTTFSFSRNAIQYSTDNGTTWTTLSASTNTPTVSTGNKILFKKTNPTITDGYGIGTFSSTGRFNVSGNIMSLLYGDNFENQTSLSGKNYVFAQMFYNCKNIVNTSHLILPTTLSDYCYSMMFGGCSALTSTPALPSTTLTQHCYYSMFYSCASLTSAPALPATTLANHCYRMMFGSCSSLTSIPVLPATTLASYCYESMFSNCIGLTSIPTLPATTLASYCYQSMFSSCSGLTSTPILPATTLAEGCYTNMFRYCTNLRTTTTLPATTLVDECYSNMFYGCRNLTSAPTLPATTLADGCYRNMFCNCINLTSAPALPATTLAESCYVDMFSGCIHLVSAPALPALTATRSCYMRMFHNCASLTSAPSLPATRLDISCYENMFSGCAGLTSAPYILPATTLTTSCYSYMFYGCTSLRTSPILPAVDINVYACYYNMFTGCSSLNNITCYGEGNFDTYNTEYWVSGVSATGTFTGDPDATWTVGVHGVPENWNSNINVLNPFVSNGTLGMYIDDFLKINEPIENWVDDPYEYGSNEYIYINDTITYNGRTYYIWERTDGNEPNTNYALTTTVNYNTLYQQSIEYDYANLVSHPVSFFFDDDMNEYSNCNDQNILKVTQSNGQLRMLVDDFINPDIDVNDFIDDPELLGSNYYEYCEPFEYDDETYYIWVFVDTLHNTDDGTVKYILTDTINLQTLRSYSLESSLSNLGRYPIVAYFNDDFDEYGSTRFDNIVKVFSLGGYHSAGTLGMYIDDFLKANPDDFVDDPIGNGSRAYEYTGEDISYDGDDYYLWKRMSYTSTNKGGGPFYALTSTINQNTLQQKSLDNSILNVFEHPIYVHLDDDANEYGTGDGYSIVSVSQTTGLEMWIDNEFDDGMNGDGYSTMSDYLDWYLDNLDEAGGKHYYYVGQFEYDGDSCYLWINYIDNSYLVTDTINLQTLQAYSIESNYSNINTHPIVAFLRYDLIHEYDRGSYPYSIVKVTSSQPKLMMYVDDFLPEDLNMNDFIDDPESMGSNYYEYCEEFEYDGDTYYIWEMIEYSTYSDTVKYILTDTINLQTLQSYSLESSINNISVHPIVAYLDNDLNETYTNSDRLDNIITVFEL